MSKHLRRYEKAFKELVKELNSDQWRDHTSYISRFSGVNRETIRLWKSGKKVHFPRIENFIAVCEAVEREDLIP